MIREELYGLSRETCSGVLSPFCRGGDQHSGSLDQSTEPALLRRLRRDQSTALGWGYPTHTGLPAVKGVPAGDRQGSATSGNAQRGR